MAVIFCLFTFVKVRREKVCEFAERPCVSIHSQSLSATFRNVTKMLEVLTSYLKKLCNKLQGRTFKSSKLKDLNIFFI